MAECFFLFFFSKPAPKSRAHLTRNIEKKNSVALVIIKNEVLPHRARIPRQRYSSHRFAINYILSEHAKRHSPPPAIPLPIIIIDSLLLCQPALFWDMLRLGRVQSTGREHYTLYVYFKSLLTGVHHRALATSLHH